jgi:MFS family permease
MRTGVAYLVAFAAAAVAAGLGRAVTTTYLPVLLNDVRDAPGLIGTVMLVNAAAGFAVPLFVGVWSDRGRRRMPFILGGSLITAGGLAAVAVGSGSSYLVLAASGAVVYVGLNAVTTAHRALVPDCFEPGGRPRATSAQELAMLIGGLAGIAAGGALTETAAWAPFALAAAVVPLLALPTLMIVRDRGATLSRERQSHPAGYYARAVARPGVLAFLVAQIFWVLGYAAMPVFFVLYAESVLGLEAGTASLWLVGFGLATAAAMLAAGRTRNPARQKPLLALGVASMGIGFLTVALSTSLVAVGGALLAAAVGFGLISTLGFPLFSALIPEGEEGGYTALYFSVRAISSAIALPTVGWAIAVTGSYRTMFALGGAVTLSALVALVWVPAIREAGAVQRHTALRLPARRWMLMWAGGLAALYALTLGAGLLNAATSLHRLDEALFRAVNSLGPGPRLVFEVLEEPVQNFLFLGAVAVGAAVVARSRRVPAVLALEVLSAGLALGLLEAIYAAYDRPRPSEVFEPSAVVLAYDHNWAQIESFPSGHMAVATALAAAAWLTFPRLRLPLAAFVGLHAFARLLFGAHFPIDVAVGTVLGYASARAMFALLVEARVLDRSPRAAVGRRA